MKSKDSKEILLKYHSGEATEEEKKWLENWVMNGLESDFDLNEYEFLNDLTEIRNRLLVKEQSKGIKPLLLRITAAASVLIALSVGAYFILKTPAPKPDLVQQKHTPIVPGGNKAMLTLTDGSVIELNSATNGKIAQQDGVSITNTDDGELVYTVADKASKTGAPLYNAISTPKGGEYELSLPDGTKVWLNAASSLRFPTCFTGKERKVYLSGEAYFEVSRNKKMPFIVSSGDATVEVLGTHFNIKAYKDEEALKTTLLEGSVRVYGKKNSILLTPGQQATLSYTSDQINITNAKITEVMAWKNGYFIFKNSSLKDIMNQISRWYDVDVEYQCDPRNKYFGGMYSKDKDINELLKGLELTKNVHFKIEGRRIIVTR